MLGQALHDGLILCVRTKFFKLHVNLHCFRII